MCPGVKSELPGIFLALNKKVIIKAKNKSYPKGDKNHESQHS
jgi:hypothetical protein